MGFANAQPILRTSPRVSLRSSGLGFFARCAGCRYDASCGGIGAEPMWKAFWRKWTIDRPAAFGDFLWEVLVVQLAALLDRVTLRDIIAFIPIVILVCAYAQHIPLPPELMLLAALLAYIDTVSALFRLGVPTRLGTIVFIVMQA